MTTPRERQLERVKEENLTALNDGTNRIKVCLKEITSSGAWITFGPKLNMWLPFTNMTYHEKRSWRSLCKKQGIVAVA